MKIFLSILCTLCLISATEQGVKIDSEITKKIFIPKERELKACTNCPDVPRDLNKIKSLEDKTKEKKN